MVFLEKIADKFLKEYGNQIHRLAFVFPTRRAGLYFLYHLQRQKGAGITLWVPRLFSISDFFVRLSELTVPDPLDLIFELYTIYTKNIRDYPKEFTDFYPWGKMIIADFDEIDKHLIDTDNLFRILKEFKGVEDQYREGKSEIHNRYVGFWEDLGTIYREFNRVLREKKRAYEGMVYREVAQDPQKGIKGIVLEWDKVIFCGFNALNRAEETIIQHLLNEEKGEIYWDMDRYFVDDFNQEAGYFFRQNRLIFDRSQSRWIEDRLSEPRSINIIGVQSRVSQAKVLGIKLQQLQESFTSQDPQKVAVVLPDETLLFPLLNSLPGSIDRINITIGFPLQQSPVYSLFAAIIDMQVRVSETRAAGTEFYHKDMQRILNHPYVKPLAPHEINNFISRIRGENRVYVTQEDIITLPEPLRGLFRVCQDSGQITLFFMTLLDSLRQFYKENMPGLFSIDYEFIYHFYTLLTRLKDSLDNTGMVLDIPTFRQLFTDIVKASRVPFTGEPLEGLQVMGVLETQTLAFENLFVLSVNEGYLPPGKSHQSFIPFDVRTEVGLPTYKEQGAIFAYHFYRMLKNSRNITLLYTSEAAGIEKSEKSRFIDQILIEFSDKNPQAEILHQVIDFSFDAQKAEDIVCEKSQEIIELLSKRGYSASSLLTYLTCPLKFFLSYLLKLREEEEVYESPDQRLVGTILHEALKELYQPLCGNDQAVSAREIENIKARLVPVLTRAFRSALKSGPPDTGRNRIAFEVMKEFLNQFFEKEKQDAGFKILMLEEKIEDVALHFSINGASYSVNLEGHIDRLDITRDRIYRIIDYKTGKVNPLNLESLAELTGPQAAERREAFQLFFYCYLLKRRQIHSDRPFCLGIYPFKKIYEELRFVKIDKSDVIDNPLIARFDELLKSIFRELFDIKTAFVQTKNEQHCRYCPYTNICSRDPGEYYV